MNCPLCESGSLCPIHDEEYPQVMTDEPDIKTPLDVMCPRCGAGTGLECRYPSSQPLPVGKFHAMRVTAYQKAKAAMVEEAAAYVHSLRQGKVKKPSKKAKVKAAKAQHKARRLKVLSKSYVWCNAHQVIHGFTGGSKIGNAVCGPADYRKVYVQSTDPDEEF